MTYYLASEVTDYCNNTGASMLEQVVINTYGDTAQQWRPDAGWRAEYLRYQRETVMGREVRRVPADWQHPTKDGLEYIPLYGSNYEAEASGWDEKSAEWERGEFPDYVCEESKKLTYSEWYGERPEAKDYMPTWTPEQATHFMMYETCSEGTPISPAFATPEELAHWLADTGASAFGDQTASYEGWLRVANGGYAPSAVFTPATGLRSGVDGL